MNETSRRILDHFQVRKTKKQKEEFRKHIIHELNQYGYCPSIQHKGINNNIIIGNIEKAKIFFVWSDFITISHYYLYINSYILYEHRSYSIICLDRSI